MGLGYGAGESEALRAAIGLVRAGILQDDAEGDGVAVVGLVPTEGQADQVTAAFNRMPTQKMVTVEADTSSRDAAQAASGTLLSRAHQAHYRLLTGICDRVTIRGPSATVG